MAHEFLVVGLGIFGRAVVRRLDEAGVAVLAVDRDPRAVEEVAEALDVVAATVDATDEAAMRELGMQRVSCAVVALGVDSKESSILATALLSQLGVPQIVARSLGPLHARVLRAVGAHRVVSPEEEMGKRLARQLATPSVLDRLDLGDETVLAEVEVPETFVGRTLLQLDLRRRQGITVVALRRGGRVEAGVDPDLELKSGDVMVVVGSEKAVERLGALA
jgi:trk system potassium uptake protein TrkA